MADVSDRRSLSELLAEADLVRKICRQMCVYDGVDPDASMGLEAPYDKLKNWEHHSADVNAVLRAMKAIAS